MRMERGIFNGALIVLSFLATLLPGGVTTGRAADIRVMSGGAVKPALTELAEASRRRRVTGSISHLPPWAPSSSR
jgi:hypothetical protein